MSSAFDEFKQVLKAFSYLSSWAIAAGAPPFIFALGSLAPPPWPKEIAVIAGVTDMIVLILVYLYGSSKGNMNRRVAGSVVILGFSVAAYFFALNHYTFVRPDGKTRALKGFIYTEKMSLVKRENPLANDDMILSWSRYDASALWKKWSIDAIAQCLNMLWLLSFATLSTVIGLFIISQIRRDSTIRDA